jgi:hypothetical protein
LFDIESALKDAALVGLAVGIIAMAIYMIWAYGDYLAAPKVRVAAATPKPAFGFQLPE